VSPISSVESPLLDYDWHVNKIIIIIIIIIIVIIIIIIIIINIIR